MHKRYLPVTRESCIAHVIEECGEVVAAAGKSLRFGLNAVNPELPEDQQEKNRDWLVREMYDAEAAMRRCRRALGCK